MYRLYGGAFAFIAIATMGAMNAYERNANFAPVTAKIWTIKRTCNFTVTTSDYNGKQIGAAKSDTTDCEDTPEFSSIRETRSKRVDGTAVVKFSYTSPVDNSFQSGEFKYDGGDDEFYNLHADQTITILASKTKRDEYRKF